MPDIVKELNLNRHPKNIKDLSLVYAKNVRLSNDTTTIQTEESIFNHPVINNVLRDKVLVGYISCAKEVILFVTNEKYNKTDGSAINCSIYRYNELENDIKRVYDKYKYHGGNINGDFTYNVNDELIVAIGESFDEVTDLTPFVPLNTINLGKWEDILGIDYDLSYEQLSNNPIVKVPSFDFNYTSGLAYKGWYYTFIRFKINRNNYTNWFSVGYPIYINDIDDVSIFQYFQSYNYVNPGEDNNNYLQAVGAVDAISSEREICYKSIEYYFNFYNNSYTEYQFAVVCAGKSSTRVFKSLDLDTIENQITLDISKLENYSLEELLNYNYNAYNVKNIKNYQNKLYISNFYDNDYENNINAFKLIAENLDLTIENENVVIDDIKVKDEDILPPNSETRISYSGMGYNHRQDECQLRNAIAETIDNKSTFKDRMKNSTLIPNNSYKFYIHFVNEYGEYTEGFPIRNNSGRNVDLYRDSYTYYITQVDSNLVTDIENETYTIKRYYPKLNTTLSSVNFPKGYVGCFLSYEKYEPYKKITGIASGNSFRPFAYELGEAGSVKYTYPESLNDEHTLYFYTDQIHTLSNKNITGTHIRLESKNYFNAAIGCLSFNSNNDGSDRWSFGTTDNSYTNIEEISKISKHKISSANSDETYNDALLHNGEFNVVEFEIESIEYVPSDNIKYNTKDTSGYLKVKVKNDISGFFNNDIYKASIYDRSKKYLSNSKKLIKFTNVFYKDDSSINNSPIELKYGLNGRITYSSAFIFNKDGVLLNELGTITDNSYRSYLVADKEQQTLNDNDTKKIVKCFLWKIDGGLGAKNVIPFLYYRFFDYSDVVIEGRNFKESLINSAQLTDYSYLVLPNTIALPNMIDDLFEERYGSQDDFNPRTYTNYREDLTTIFKYDKRVKRSQVIQDESLNNDWRKFPVEAYKDLTTNKGLITNITAFKDKLLVHTEHSLFFLSKDEKLVSKDNTINISAGDIFDIDFKEVVHSNKGLAGLQDKYASFTGEFGYIFYDNDAYSFYIFDEKGLTKIDTLINEYIYKYRPYKVRFADDKDRYRILICMSFMNENKDEWQLTLSYNYIVNQFISEHTYNFDEGFSTKGNVYFIKNYKKLNSITYYINNDFKTGNRSNFLLTNEEFLKNKHYNYFENFFKEDINSNSEISIIINNNYENIKNLEFIVYKLYEIQQSITNGISPVEEDIRIPYAGLSIEIRNSLFNDIDMVSTGEIDVSDAEYTNFKESQSPMVYKLPYWHNGNWNFNYIRNKLNELDSRMWGNYFIVTFKFGRNNLKSEFETLNYSISKNEV